MASESSILRTSRAQGLIDHIKQQAHTLKDNDAFKNPKSPQKGPRFRAHLVLQGGGTLGIAHLGAIHGLEIAGIRFVGLAGTSAGAIVALMMTCARKKLEEPVASRLISLLETLPFAAFIDAPPRVRRAVNHFVGHLRLPAVDLVFPIANSAARILRHFGLNPGAAFHDWLSVTLATEFEVRTMDDLDSRLDACLSEVNGNHPRTSDETSVPLHRKLLKIVATALPYGLKVTFPQDCNLLDARYRRMSPGFMARASMSVPLFFEPYELLLDRNAWLEWVNRRERRWQTQDAVKRLLSLQALHFVDGGMLSNFPIDAFIDYESGTIRPLFNYPTIGISLVSGVEPRVRYGRTARLTRHASEILRAVRQQRDREAFDFARALMLAETIPDGNIQICPVDTGRHNWLNFSLQSQQAADLFCRGLEGALEWLTQQGSTRNLY